MLVVGAILLAASRVLAAEKDEAKGDKVEFHVYDGYFESNKSGLKGDASFLAFTDDAAFDKIFGKAVVMGKKQSFLPKDAFETKLVFATIKRGDKMWEYKIEKVTAEKDTLYVQYTATSKDGGGATFASPLIVSVDKGKYTSVVFIEDGKKAGTATIGK
jgi:adenine-specific DNA methylase